MALCNYCTRVRTSADLRKGHRLRLVSFSLHVMADLLSKIKVNFKKTSGFNSRLFLELSDDIKKTFTAKQLFRY